MSITLRNRIEIAGMLAAMSTILPCARYEPKQKRAVPLHIQAELKDSATAKRYRKNDLRALNHTWSGNKLLKVRLVAQ